MGRKVTESKVAAICRQEDWDICQIGLELGNEFTDTQLGHDAVWARIQDIPLTWTEKEKWVVAYGNRNDAVSWMTKQVRMVVSAPPSRRREMLPHDHPQRA